MEGQLRDAIPGEGEWDECGHQFDTTNHEIEVQIGTTAIFWH
jgi:hypothetical protein